MAQIGSSCAGRGASPGMAESLQSGCTHTVSGPVYHAG